jgi:hypothetical protein
MLRYVILFIVAIVFATTAIAGPIAKFKKLSSEPFSVPTVNKKLRVKVKDVLVRESKGNRILLEVSWDYIEQDNLRPSEISIIAILIGARGKEYKATVNLPVNATGPLPTNAKVVINHEEQIVSPRDFKFVATVALQIKDGTSNTFVGDKKEVRLRINPNNQ